MKIYQVHCNGEKFQTLNFDKWPEDRDYRRFICLPKEDWSNNLMYVANPQAPKSNFYATSLDALICNEETYEIFRYFLGDSCQVLPIEVERDLGKYFLFNVLTCCNCLDYDKTIWELFEDGSKAWIKEPHFLKNRVGSRSTLFKVPEFNGMKIFTFTDPSIEPQETFKGLYELNGLTGLDFYLTWSDENDEEEIKLMFF